jgi:hypothetical protein
LVEQPIRNRQVIGSSPIVGSSLQSLACLFTAPQPKPLFAAQAAADITLLDRIIMPDMGNSKARASLLRVRLA